MWLSSRSTQDGSLVRVTKSVVFDEYDGAQNGEMSPLGQHHQHHWRNDKKRGSGEFTGLSQTARMHPGAHGRWRSVVEDSGRISRESHPPKWQNCKVVVSGSLPDEKPWINLACERDHACPRAHSVAALRGRVADSPRLLQNWWRCTLQGLQRCG